MRKRKRLNEKKTSIANSITFSLLTTATLLTQTRFSALKKILPFNTSFDANWVCDSGPLSPTPSPLSAQQETQLFVHQVVVSDVTSLCMK
jgi:hypothetical protein